MFYEDKLKDWHQDFLTEMEIAKECQINDVKEQVKKCIIKLMGIMQKHYIESIKDTTNMKNNEDILRSIKSQFKQQYSIFKKWKNTLDESLKMLIDDTILVVTITWLFKNFPKDIYENLLKDILKIQRDINENYK